MGYTSQYAQGEMSKNNTPPADKKKREATSKSHRDRLAKKTQKEVASGKRKSVRSVNSPKF